MPTVKRMLSFIIKVINIKNLGRPANHEADQRTETKSISSTIDEILSQDLPAYSPDMDEPDKANQLHKCGECGAGYG